MLGLTGRAQTGRFRHLSSPETRVDHQKMNRRKATRRYACQNRMGICTGHRCLPGRWRAIARTGQTARPLKIKNAHGQFPRGVTDGTFGGPAVLAFRL